MKKRSKRFKNLLKSAIKDKKFLLKILDLLKKNSNTKFDGLLMFL